MTETNGHTPPEPLEQGRYKVFPQASGFIIARAVNTCDRCQSCDCGEQQEILDMSPAGVARLLGQARKAGLIKGFLPLGGGRE